MAKVVCVLYDDPIDGYPPKYARDNIPKITKYPDGQTARIGAFPRTRCLTRNCPTPKS
jgi:hypothetical protein